MPEPIVLSGTGHRPAKLGLSYGDADRVTLREFISLHLALIPGVTQVVSGGALGFDQALAEAALTLGLPLTFALPFDGVDSRWPPSSRDRFALLLDKASKVVLVCESPSKAAYLTRDRWMVEHSNHVLALFDGVDDGGTAFTVKLAEKAGLPVSNLWSEWRRTRPPGV